MGLEVSSGVAKEYADNIKSASDVLLSNVYEKEVQEPVFLKGRAIYDDLQKMMLTYNEVLARDINNITGIAECIEEVDGITSLDIVGYTRGE